MVKNLSHPDYILIIVTAVLLILGILILANVSASISQERFGNTYYFLNHQLLFGFLPGLILAFLAFRIPLNFFKKWAPILLLMNLVLVAMVFLPKVGFSFGGATRWISLGNITLQPAEFLKVTFILYLAAWLASRTPPQRKLGFRQVERGFTRQNFFKKNLGGFSQTLIAFLIVLGIISLLLIFQPNISTLGVIVLVGAIMYFAANTPLWHSIFIFLIGVVGLFSLIKLAPYRADRLLVFLRPETDPMGIGYQIKQALITVGSGGIAGLGLGMSGQKFGFLPAAMSDSIFAIFSEETGFIGSCVLVLLFLIFLWRAFKIAKNTQDKFSQLTCLGIAFWISFQAFINIGSMIGIVPLSGIPLPFISYGGSHMIAELIGIGILLNISKQKT